MNEQETLGRPVSESGTRITKAPAEDELGLTGVWERVRPTVMRNELPPQILLSFICSNSGSWRKNFARCSGVQKPNTCSIIARLYQLRSYSAISPWAGNQST